MSSPCPVVHLPPAEKGRPWLEQAIFRGLVFPLCWEDPEVDARALSVGARDTVLMVTSAGCNVLNALLQGPRRLICVDANPAQNALLELKIAAIAALSWTDVWDLFSGIRRPPIADIYHNRLRPRMSHLAAAFWDGRLRLVEQGLYRSGRMGLFFRAARGYLRAFGLTHERFMAFFTLSTRADQREWYEREFAPRVWRSLTRCLVGTRALAYMSGIHPRQLALLGGGATLHECVRRRVERALTEIPAQTNYFWRLALTGSFGDSAFPPYLARESFETIRHRLERVEIVYGRLEACLDRMDPASLDAVNLRDAPDWMDERDRDRLWSRLSKAVAPEGRVLLRSATSAAGVPASARATFREDAQLSASLTPLDRSATHGRVSVASRFAAAASGSESARMDR
jgi:S-adenosylmethionine-diacylglycerol 3-amino-3-carboxypropyl transferase